jgi:hypothetical protein
MNVLRRLRVLVGIGKGFFIRESIGLRLFDGSGLLNRRGAGTNTRHGNFGWQRHDDGILSVWQEHVADLLGRLVFVRRHGVRFLSRWTLCVRWRFRVLGHNVSPGDTNKLTKCHACSEEKRI